MVSLLASELRRLRWKTLKYFPESDVTCNTKNGLFTFSSWDGVIARRLYSKKHWAWREISLFSELLVSEGLLSAESENKTLVNVGANIGSVLVPVFKKFHFQRGLGFEPSPKTFSFLRQNVKQNNLAEVVDLFQIGLSDQDRTAEFELSPRNSGDHRVRETPVSESTRSRYAEHTRSTIPIELSSLDKVLAQQGVSLGPNCLLWVDIQGHEGKFFEGARQSLSGTVPVVTEFWPYGIARSGYTKQMFCDVVSDLFESVYFMSNRSWQKKPSSYVRELYGKYESGKSGIDVLLV